MENWRHKGLQVVTKDVDGGTGVYLETQTAIRDARGALETQEHTKHTGDLGAHLKMGDARVYWEHWRYKGIQRAWRHGDKGCTWRHRGIFGDIGSNQRHGGCTGGTKAYWVHWRFDLHTGCT